MPTKRQSVQQDLFGNDVRLPEGFSYRQDIISQTEEATAVRDFEALPFKPFEFRGYLGKRRVVSFGWRYDYSGRGLRE
jgi:hypothetical protein